MSSLGEGLRRLKQEFVRRRVGKIALAYLAGSWLLIEVSSQVFPALMLPEWASRLVVIVAIIGLPIVLMMAWVFDFTSHGVVRTAQLPKARVVSRKRQGHIVGRESVVQELNSAFQSIESEHGRFLGIAGEPGMGKSTVTEAFIDRLREGESECLVGSGRSSERHGETSAFMPVIEALTELVSVDESGDVAREMAKYAPTWYGLVFPGRETSDDGNAHRANSQGRMQHELCVLLSEVCARHPVVICFDDFHWADVSTLDALVYLADRLEGLRLLLLVSYRESELQHTNHPFVAARLSLQSHGLFHEIKLEPWGMAQVKAMIDAEFPENRFPEELPARIFDRTGGHPLFVVELLRYLKDAGTITQGDDGWSLATGVDQVTEGLPGSVRSMIERKMGSLSENDWRLLSAASVQGKNFDSAVLARVLDMDAADIEERLEQLERVYTLVNLVDEREMPDHTLSSHYSFGHILYQDHFLSSLRPSRKVNLARSTAEALNDFYRDQPDEVAAELAHLFALAREPRKAAAQYLACAFNSAGVFAYREAATMARSGLEILSSVPRTEEQDRQELLLQLCMGRSLCMTEGYGSHETMSCFERALKLTREMGDDEQNIDLLWSLWMAYTNTGNRRMSLELSDRLQTAASRARDPLAFAAANLAAGYGEEMAGLLPQAREHFQRVIDVEMTGTSVERASRFVADPLILARGNQLRLLALMGLRAESEERWARNLALVDSGELDPRSIAGLLIEGAWFHALYHRFDKVMQLTERTIGICSEYDFFMENQWATFLHCWAMAQLGDAEQGLDGIAGFIGFIDATGVLMHAPMYYATYGDLLARHGRATEAKKWVNRSLEVIEHTGQDYFASEVYRLQGRIAAQENQADIALTALKKAHQIAREQDARLLELRAAINLSTFLCDEGEESEGTRVLQETVQRMHTGFESDDLERAREILQETA